MNTSKLGFLAGAAIVVAGCAGHDEGTATTTAALDPAPVTSRERLPVYVALEAAQCADVTGLDCPDGFWVREVNEDRSASLVSKLDFSELGREALSQAFGAGPGQLVLRGRFVEGSGTSTFRVFDAWRGLPDVAAGPRDEYFAITRTPVGPFAARLNGASQVPALEISVAGAAGPRVDTAWLLGRVLDHGALVAGRLDGVDLQAAQIYLHLPDQVGPCIPSRLVCRDGEVATFTRDENRCEVAAACVPRRLCPMILPECERRYVLASWPSEPDGCPAFACDPAFVDR